MLNVQLEEIATGTVVQFPLTVEMLPRTGGTVGESPTILGRGEIVLLRGRKARRWTLEGSFLGAEDAGSAVAPLDLWRAPADVDSDLLDWEERGPTLLLTAVATTADVAQPWPNLAVNVQVENYDGAWGEGDALKFTVDLVEARALVIPLDAASG